MLYVQDGYTPALGVNHPRIGYNSVIRNALAEASTEVEGNEADAVLNSLTWDSWVPTTLPATLEFTLGQAASVNYLGIAAHTLYEDGCSFALDYWDGLNWIEIQDETAAEDTAPIILLFDTVTSDKFRITITGTTPPAISVVYLGIVLEVAQRLYQGHSPVNLNEKTVIRPQKSEGGQFLGRSVIREGAQTTIAFSRLTASWVRSFYKPFQDSAIKYPFFFAWRGEDFPSETAYCWTDRNIGVTNSGPRDIMSSKFTVDALIGQEPQVVDYYEYEATT